MSPNEQAFWDEVSGLIKPVTTTTAPNLEYRLHYTELGEITLCSMQDHPLTDRYVVVDKLTYDQYFLYRIVNGKPIKIEHNSGYKVKLEKSTKGFQVVKDHAGIVLEDNETHTQTEYYAYKNN